MGIKDSLQSVMSPRFTNAEQSRITAFLPLLLICLIMAMTTHGAFAAAESQSPWQQTTPLLTPRSGAGVIEVQSIIYAIGGIDGVHFLKNSEYSAIHGDGSLSAWQAGSREIHRHG